MATTNEALLMAQANFLFNPPIFTGYQSAAQSIANATFVSLGFDTNEVDTYSGHSTVTNNTRYTAQVAGWYEVTGMICFTTNNAGERRGQFMKNGSAIIASQPVGVSTAVSSSGLVMPARKVSLIVGDYVEMQAWQNSGGALNTGAGGTTCCFMSIHWIHA